MNYNQHQDGGKKRTTYQLGYHKSKILITTALNYRKRIETKGLHIVKLNKEQNYNEFVRHEKQD